MSKKRGGYRKIIESRSSKGNNFLEVRLANNPYLKTSTHIYQKKFLLTDEDREFINGKTEDVYKVQFQTTDLSKVLEGV